MMDPSSATSSTGWHFRGLTQRISHQWNPNPSVRVDRCRRASYRL